MATSFLGKLNTLLRASINSVVSGNSSASQTEELRASRISRITQQLAGKDLDKEIENLRQQVRVATEDEQKMADRLAALEEDIKKWDKQADKALMYKRDAEARQAVAQLETLKSQRTAIQTEFDTHHTALAELQTQIDELALIAGEVAAKAEVALDAVEGDAPTLSQAISEARQSVMVEAGEPNLSIENAIRVDVDKIAEDAKPDNDAIETDLAARRSRLAKPE